MVTPHHAAFEIDSVRVVAIDSRARHATRGGAALSAV
jgi:hypothetical protein